MKKEKEQVSAGVQKAGNIAKYIILGFLALVVLIVIIAALTGGDSEKDPNALSVDQQTYVQIACTEAGKAQFPYGFEPAELIDSMQKPVKQDDGRVFYKAKAQATNEAGASQEVTFECHVDGSNIDKVESSKQVKVLDFTAF